MAEWRQFWFPRDRAATGLFYWPASEEGPERISFARAWDHWPTVATPPTHWIPCAAPGTQPPSMLQRVQLLPERIADRVWPHMGEGFLEFHLNRALDALFAAWWWITDPSYSHRIALGVDDEARAAYAIEGVVGKRLTYRRPDERPQA